MDQRERQQELSLEIFTLASLFQDLTPPGAPLKLDSSYGQCTYFGRVKMPIAVRSKNPPTLGMALYAKTFLPESCEIYIDMLDCEEDGDFPAGLQDAMTSGLLVWLPSLELGSLKWLGGTFQPGREGKLVLNGNSLPAPNGISVRLAADVFDFDPLGNCNCSWDPLRGRLVLETSRDIWPGAEITLNYLASPIPESAILSPVDDPTPKAIFHELQGLESQASPSSQICLENETTTKRGSSSSEDSKDGGALLNGWKIS